MHRIEPIACFDVETSYVVKALRHALLFERCQKLVFGGFHTGFEAFAGREHLEIVREIIGVGLHK